MVNIIRSSGEWRSLHAHVAQPDELVFLAKHALSSHDFDKVDGNHLKYHRDIRKELEGLYDNVTAINKFEDLLGTPAGAYVFSLFNRAGFDNSEVLASTLCEMRSLKYLGAKPVVRAASDDKHFAKQIIAHLGYSMPRWIAVREGRVLGDPFDSARGFILKPLARSASEGIHRAQSFTEALQKLEALGHSGRNYIIEEFIAGTNISVPVFNGSVPVALPPVVETADNVENVITNGSKRGFERPVERALLQQTPEALAKMALDCATRFGPFDYGRVDIRVCEKSARPYFLEFNISCNLQRGKSIDFAASSVGICYRDLVDGIVRQSLIRQSL